MSDDNPAISVRDAAFSWPGGFSIEIDRFEIAAGERVMLLGPSGGGKSTLLNLVAGIVPPSHGCVDILGTNIAALRGANADGYRADSFGIIFQQFNLLPWLSARDNVLIPLRFSKKRRKRAAPVKQSAERLLSALGIEPALFRTPAGQLSVGQQQRVAAARALIGGPGIILADEPTSALDSRNAAGFLDLLYGEIAEAGSALLMVSHDETLAAGFDRVLRLEEILNTDRQAA